MKSSPSGAPSRWRTPPRPARAAVATLSALALAAYALIATSTAAHAAPTLLSQGKTTTASSLENATFPASNAVDGNTGTRCRRRSATRSGSR